MSYMRSFTSHTSTRFLNNVFNETICVSIMIPHEKFKASWKLSSCLRCLSAASAAVAACSGRGLTSAVSGEVQQQDVGAEAAQVVQRLQVLLQFPVGQFALQDGRQVTEHVGVQRRRPAESHSKQV